MLADHPGRGAALGQGDDGRGLHLLGDQHRRVAHSVRDADDRTAFAAGKTPDPQLLLGPVDDAPHRGHRLDRIGPRGRLPGEHDGIRTVQDGIGDVAGLGAGGTGIADHRVQHLRRHDHDLAPGAAHLDDMLLHQRNVLRRDLDPQIAARDHHAVHDVDDLRQVLDGLVGLDLRDDLHRPPAALDQLADLEDVGPGLDEGDGKVLHPVLDAPGDVLLVLLGERRKRQGRSGDVDPLRVPQGPPDDDAAADVLALHPLDLQMQGAVVDVDVLPGEDLPRQKGVIDVDALGGPDEGLPGPREDDGVPADQRDLPVLHLPRADLGALRVQEGGDGGPRIPLHAPDKVQLPLVPLVIAVAEVQARNVHPRPGHRHERPVVLAGRAYRTDDFYKHLPLTSGLL